MHAITPTLQALHAAANAACRRAIQERPILGGILLAENLACVGTEYYIDESGAAGHRVLLGGAKPGHVELIDFVSASLSESGFTGVEVRTGW